METTDEPIHIVNVGLRMDEGGDDSDTVLVEKYRSLVQEQVGVACGCGQYGVG